MLLEIHPRQSTWPCRSGTDPPPACYPWHFFATGSTGAGKWRAPLL